jgi:hypothetical protein
MNLGRHSSNEDEEGKFLDDGVNFWVWDKEPLAPVLTTSLDKLGLGRVVGNLVS